MDWATTEFKNGKIKYIVEEKKDETTTIQIYAGFGLDCKVEDLDSLKVYKYRIRVELNGTTTFAESEWMTVTTEKQPIGIMNLNKAIKRDDAVKVRLMLTSEKVPLFLMNNVIQLTLFEWSRSEIDSFFVSCHLICLLSRIFVM